MIAFLYNILIQIIEWLMWIPAMISKKIKLGWIGRKKSFELLNAQIMDQDKIIWMHVASLGEFEQGRPILDELKKIYVNHKIVLTFFSPSGYEKRKTYPNADMVCYLPLDTRQNAKRFVQKLNPDLTVFIKYEFWPNYLQQLKKHNGKAILISTVIHDNNWLLLNSKKWFKVLISSFDTILCQDKRSHDLLEDLNVDSKLLIGGDTRIDRTIQVASESDMIPIIEQFVSGKKVLIAGSSWSKDEGLIKELVRDKCFNNWKLIIAPHNVSSHNIDRITGMFPNSIRYSEMGANYNNQSVLIIDNIGLLNRLYRYAQIAYIGGGFGQGIHNTLEPAAYGIPIIFGPNYEKFIEAVVMIAEGGAFSINSSKELIKIFKALDDTKNYSTAADVVNNFMQSNNGAVDIAIKEIRLLLSAEN